MLKLSIIIVNYNVKHFLEQCLYSVQRATASIEAEVWVVDNASGDNSVALLQARFPFVKIIANTVNTGFAKANNQALEQCQGKYVLFLNPDTLLPEDCLRNCIGYMETAENAGALGIRMLDGNGKFLPESKRSFPGLATSFYKLTGLSSVFPRSKVFGKYALGYLHPQQNHKVDVLAGAFMMANTTLLKQLGGFDEAFFMYGEDIDLSYRVQLAGFSNYYFGESCIIHFKGESTKKGTFNYVKTFYEAMSLFVSKHHSNQKSRLFKYLVKLAIWLRALISLAGSFLFKAKNSLAEVGCISLAFLIVWLLRSKQFGLTNNLAVELPAFVVTYWVFSRLAGKRGSNLRGMLMTALLTSITLLLLNILRQPVNQTSTAVLLSSCMLNIVLLTLKYFIVEKYFRQQYKTCLVVGAESDLLHLQHLFNVAKVQHSITGFVAPNASFDQTLAILKRQLAANSANELIFCIGALTYQMAIQLMIALPGISFRFHAQGSQSVVGSDSKNRAGEIISFD